MSDTPETDLEDDLFVDCDDSCASFAVIKASTGEAFTGDFVPAEFARRLERERDQAQYLVKTLSAKCDKIEADKEYNAQLVREFRSERDQLRAINAELLVAIGVVLDDWQDGFESHQADSYDIARDVLTKAKAIKL
jgi:hypothetical protein